MARKQAMVTRTEPDRIRGTTPMKSTRRYLRERVCHVKITPRNHLSSTHAYRYVSHFDALVEPKVWQIVTPEE